MRQVNQDELTYALFSAMRGWSVSTRREIFERRNHGRRHSAAQQISDKLRVYAVLGGSGAVLDRDARAAIFDSAIAAFPGAIGRLWLSNIHERETDARRGAAILLYQSLQPYEVLADSPFGSTLFFADITAPPYAFASTWP